MEYISKFLQSLQTSESPSRDEISEKKVEQVLNVPSGFSLEGFKPQYYDSINSFSHLKQRNPDYNPDEIYNYIPSGIKNTLKRWIEQNPIVEREKKETGFDSVVSDGEFQELPTRIEVDDPSKLTHNNMVPFYKGSVKQNINPENRLAEHKLELYTGQYQLRQPAKKEVPKMFEPVANLTNVNGSHTLTTLLDAKMGPNEPSRFNPNNHGKRNNETPFEQIYVGPGLNQGFKASPSGGFHDQVRILPRVSEQLNVNAKVETSGRVLAGSAIGKKSMVASQVYNYRPKLLVDNTNGERNFTTVGEVTAPTVRSPVILKCTDRSVLTDQVIGPAGPADIHLSRPEEMFAKSKISTRQNYDNTPYRNLGQAEGKGMNDLGKSSFRNAPNERAVTGPRSGDQNFRSLTTVVKELTMSLFDKQRDTKRQEMDCHPRPYGNMQPVKPSSPVVVDPQWNARTTIRETTENNDWIGGVERTVMQSGQGYQTGDWVPKNTQKQYTSDNEYIGGAEASHKKAKLYDDAYNAQLNVNKECIAQGRMPTISGPKSLNHYVNMETKKMDTDREDQGRRVPTSTTKTCFNNTVTLTSGKNVGQVDYISGRIDPVMVDAHVKNPLTQSLSSVY